jgi:multiple sugar transport system permease protein
MTGITARLKRSKYRRELLNKFLAHAVLWIIAGTIGAPFFWLVTTSLKSFREIFVFPPVWFPETLRWENYVKAWQAAPFGQFYVNSVIVSVVGVGLSLACCVLAQRGGISLCSLCSYLP